MLARILRKAVPRESVRHDLRQVRASVSRLLRGVGAEMFARARVPRSNAGEVKLNIGCGDRIAAGWINIDRQGRAGSCYANVLNGLAFADATVTRIHCEHFLEHLEFDHARRFLAECLRVLLPGGDLRLVVPDAGRYCEAYAAHDAQFFARLDHLGGAVEALRTPMQVINQMFRMGGEHRFAWDYETLRDVLLAAGFARVARSHGGDASAGPVLDGDEWWRELESLYVEARK